MKYSLAIILFSFLFSAATGQTQKAKELGKLNYNGNAELKLSATVEEGQFTYTLTDLTKPDKPIFSFGLIENSLENFKKNIPDNSEEKYKKPDEKELEKYFYFFLNQNIFLIENSKGGKAMDMRFNDSFEVYSFNHPDFSTIKPRDIYILLKELFPETALDQSNFSNSTDFFDPSKYASFKLVDSSKPQTTSTTITSTTTPTSNPTNPTDAPIFNDSFKARLEKIKTLKPKAVKWEELYKEINYRYYKALIAKMTKQVTDENKENDKKLKEVEDSIINSTLKLQSYVRDSISLSEERTQLQSELNKTITQIEDLKIRIPSSLELFTLNDSLNLDNERRILLQEKIQRNKGRLTTFGIKPTDRSLPESIQNFSDVDKLIKDDSVKIEDILRNIQVRTSAEIRRNLIEAEILHNSDRISSVFKSSSDERRIITRLTSDKGAIQTKNEKKIADDLKDLNKSNKYQFTAEKIQMEVNRGYLENVIVSGNASVFIEKNFQNYIGKGSFETFPLKFINDYPIGISAKKDIERLSNIKL